ncbi:hypothetical protein [Mucilaginibacter sp.]|uniref:hypothetical protein n=1 Tax=Mucilaginibacter sp. TaxID=1882438 RepID=UPI0035BC9339
MDVNKIHSLMRDIHFRKEFYLVTMVALIVLIVINYKLLPALSGDKGGHRWANSFINFLIFAVAAAIVIFSALFWLNGNN